MSKYAARVVFYHGRTESWKGRYCTSLESAQTFYEALRNESWCLRASLEVRETYRGDVIYRGVRSHDRSQVPGAQLICTRAFNNAPEGRDPIWRETDLYKVKYREPGGLQFYLRPHHGASQTWLCDAEAERWAAGPYKRAGE